MYIADFNNNRIRKVTISTGIITTIAGSSTSGSYSGDNGAATSAGLNDPYGVAVDSAGRQLNDLFVILKLLLIYSSIFALGNVYFSDFSNHRLRKVTVSTGIITLIAGTGASSYSGDNGPATSATLNYPMGVAVDTSDNVYIADNENHRIRKVTVSTGIITTIAGTGTRSYSGDNGQATAAELYYPTGLALDSAGTQR